jgi:hypothetical protein
MRHRSDITYYLLPLPNGLRMGDVHTLCKSIIFFVSNISSKSVWMGWGKKSLKSVDYV